MWVSSSEYYWAAYNTLEEIPPTKDGSLLPVITTQFNRPKIKTKMFDNRGDEIMLEVAGKS